MPDPLDHFAYCIQLLVGVTPASRRLGIDERAIRRFSSGERPISAGLLQDLAKTLHQLAAEAQAAEAAIAEILTAEPAPPPAG